MRVRGGGGGGRVTPVGDGPGIVVSFRVSKGFLGHKV